jgi:hypothetical protein
MSMDEILVRSRKGGIRKIGRGIVRGNEIGKGKRMWI